MFTENPGVSGDDQYAKWSQFVLPFFPLTVRSRRNGQILAMKCISKQMLARRNHTAYMQAERDIMTKVSHPFVVALQCAFQTENKLFLVMEYLPGGELFFHLSKKGLFLEEYARFYAAEMVLALDHLHSKGIIHRDLKPENLLLGADGHICLTDFGLAKELSHAEDEGLKTICGTNEYMAPEMILRKGYGKAVDWWSMGALVYEMTAGYPPFQGKTPKDLNRKILNERVTLPKWLSSTAHQVLRGFLERNVSRRLGAKKTTMFDIGGATAVKHHSFFEGIDWAKLIALQVEPPLIPDLGSTTDTSNFCSEFVQMALPRSLSEDSVLSNTGPPGSRIAGEGAGMFRGFSFVADSFVDEEDWQLGQRGQDLGTLPDELYGVGGGGSGTRANGAEGNTELTPPKKVKGKRVRNKKGKGKGVQAEAEGEGQRPSEVNQGDKSTHSEARDGDTGSNIGIPTRGSCTSSRTVEKDAFVRHPVSEVESKTKQSALAAMLAVQKERHPLLSGSIPSGPQRTNVWAAKELPSPAPVPTPAGPPRAHVRHSGTGTFSEQGRIASSKAKDANSLPGRRLAGSAFVWRRPV